MKAMLSILVVVFQFSKSFLYKMSFQGLNSHGLSKQNPAKEVSTL